MSETTPAGAPPEKHGAMAEIVEIIKTVVYALAIALFLRVLFFQPYTIPSASMEPNLYEGDYIIVSKWSYGYSKYSIPFAPPVMSGRLFEKKAHRGDIVVFALPHDPHVDYIKRVIGLPGDRIQMKHDVLYLNGNAVQTTPAGVGPASCAFGLATNVPRYRETLPGGHEFIVNDCQANGDLSNT